MKYLVSQSFESLGSEGREIVATRQEAEAVAATHRAVIAEMVSEWVVPEGEERPTGYSAEFHAWREARYMASGSREYGKQAGRFIAYLAVMIEEIEEDESL